MRGFAGFLALSAGLGVGAYIYDPSLFATVHVPTLSGWFAEEPRISLALAERSGLVETASSAGADRPRVFSPQSPLFSPVITAAPSAPAAARSDITRVRGGAVADSGVPTGRATAGDAHNPVNTVSASGATGAAVVVAQAQAQPITRPVSDWAATVTRNASVKGGVHTGSSKPTDPETRATLVRDIQTHLKRVGCYEGDIDGSWGPASKRAMSTFTERINATLPIDDPDYILLTLVQGHRATACGDQCPAGQAMSDGHCVPHAVVAGAARKARKPTEATVVAASEPVAATERAAAKAGKAPPVATVAAASPPAEAPVANVAEARVPTAKATSERTIAETIAAGTSIVATSDREPAHSAAKSDVSEAKVAAQRHAPITRTLRRGDDSRVVAHAEEELPASKPVRAAPPVTVAVVAKPVVAKPEPARAPVEPLPGRMTIGGPVPNRIQNADPVTASQAASDDDDDGASAKPHRAAKPRSNHVVRAPRPVHAPAPRVVRHPPPAVRHQVHVPQRYVAPYRAKGSSAASRQRAMVYNLFQRPDRY